MSNAHGAAEPSPPVELDATVRALLDGRNFAVVATLNPDGGPQTSVVWVGTERNAVVFSTTTTRVKARNLARDPRVSLTVYDLANPYRSVEIRGTAELLPDPGRTLPRRLSRRYLGEDPPAEPADVERLIVRVTARRVVATSV
ncbi:TIGR03618 family F420-dependent PPOX class oxidoreductase [Streptomyces sp. 3MP-14]|uniref:TIGR03618 family F420-dependent PPOX class oxidoreductase n=1 Tax=Streptomyces mimosae TaxID=2586635 RepID=A0A5N6A605_9ACTN|nr:MULTISPECIES: PPOX class F420-dependent oxidoreductase [Streptomyces]KAB8164234.1 TIGR03618 family F420-dependent PPOX class oxidoreductase [Streptomyces mimosae]KAB8176511.1 TIGR03618 family F420-dependent PPOX class oxidoreductase [Streptomyces sp. 3MP-14]